MALSRVRTLISQQHLSGRRGNTVQTSNSVEKLQIVQGCIRLDALQSLRSFQRSSASVHTTWQYRPDASQSSRRIKFSFIDTDLGRQLQSSRRQAYTVWTLSLIRQDVEKNCNHLEARATASGRQSLLWKLCAAEVQPFGR
jgi:hypothetical protein